MGAVGPQGPDAGAHFISAEATEALAAGDFVELYSQDGNLRTRLADTLLLRPASGFVLQPALSGTSAQVYLLSEVNLACTGLIPGKLYFLGQTGKLLMVPDLSSGRLFQQMGVALSATSLQTLNSFPIELM